jgi:uroporphyrinogen-III synthase
VPARPYSDRGALRGYIDAVGAELARRAPAVSIGPVTSDAVRAAGIPLGGEATDASIAALADATVRLVGDGRSAG